jgi:hypothetical protein
MGRNGLRPVSLLETLVYGLTSRLCAFRADDDGFVADPFIPVLTSDEEGSPKERGSSSTQEVPTWASASATS